MSADEITISDENPFQHTCLYSSSNCEIFDQQPEEALSSDENANVDIDEYYLLALQLVIGACCGILFLASRQLIKREKEGRENISSRSADAVSRNNKRHASSVQGNSVVSTKSLINGFVSVESGEVILHRNLNNHNNSPPSIVTTDDKRKMVDISILSETSTSPLELIKEESDEKEPIAGDDIKSIKVSNQDKAKDDKNSSHSSSYTSRNSYQSAKKSAHGFYMRVCDLQIMKLAGRAVGRFNEYKVHPIVTNDATSKKVECLDFGADEELIEKAVTALLRNAIDLACTDDGSTGVDWQADKATAKILKRSASEIQEYIDTTGLLYWMGQVNPNGKFGKAYGRSAPISKTRAIVNHSPRNLALLLLDSKRVKEYNASTLGRDDVHYFEEGIDTQGFIGGETKIVRNNTMIPFLNTKMELINFMHGRKISEDEMGETYVVVTRGVRKCNSHASSAGEIILGANVIQPVEGSPGKSLITSVNHVTTPAGVPNFIASKVQFKGANDFLAGIRKI